MDFLQKLEEEKKKRDISNLTIECALKTSPQIIIDFHLASLKKKVEIVSGKSGKNKNSNFTPMRLPILSVEFCCVQGLGVQLSISPSEHCYGSKEPSPKTLLIFLELSFSEDFIL